MLPGKRDRAFPESCPVVPPKVGTTPPCYIAMETLGRVGGDQERGDRIAGCQLSNHQADDHGLNAVVLAVSDASAFAVSTMKEKDGEGVRL